MPSVCLYFQIHQPYRLRRYTVFDMGNNSIYEDDDRNCDNMLRLARNAYLPMNDIIYNHIRKYGKDFKVAFSISGTALDQFEQYAPEVIDSFKGLADTGCVEFLGETYSHTLAFLKSKKEFIRQVKQHSERIYDLFGQKPKIFRNTELIYNNDISEIIDKMGYEAIITNGADHILAWRSPNYVYKAFKSTKLKVLLKNYSLSDDISRRFSDRNWDEWPLTAEKYAKWCHDPQNAGDVINLFLNYESFGENNKADSGIFEFMKYLPQEIMAGNNFKFNTPSEIIKLYDDVGTIDVQDYISWENEDHDITAWCGNDMQQDSLQAVFELEDNVKKVNKADITEIWQRLQSSDHFQYMSTKWFSIPYSQGFINHYPSPYDAYINYMNVLADFKLLLDSILNKNTTLSKDKPSKSKAAATKVKTTKSKEVSTKNIKDKDDKKPKKTVDLAKKPIKKLIKSK